jgi:RIO kinase 1
MTQAGEARPAARSATAGIHINAAGNPNYPRGPALPMASRTSTGREMIARHWVNAEFGALCQLHQAGVPVPYPVQVLGTEVLLEFIGESDGAAAPRLGDTRLRGSELAGLWDQLVQALVTFAGHGLAAGDMSAYNLLVHHGRLIMIDLPQVADVVANPRGAEFLDPGRHQHSQMVLRARP